MAVPSAATSIFKAAGRFGKPGMVITSPVKATIKPAPNFGTTSRIVISKFSGAPKAFGFSEKLYYVLAIQIGNLSQPFFTIWAICVLAFFSKFTLVPR